MEPGGWYGLHPLSLQNLLSDALLKGEVVSLQDQSLLLLFSQRPGSRGPLTLHSSRRLWVWCLHSGLGSVGSVSQAGGRHPFGPCARHQCRPVGAAAARISHELEPGAGQNITETTPILNGQQIGEERQNLKNGWDSEGKCSGFLLPPSLPSSLSLVLSFLLYLLVLMLGQAESSESKTKNFKRNRPSTLRASKVS